MAEKRKVRTTFRPDLEVEVSEQEYTDLRRQDLIVEQEQDKPEPTRRAARRETEGN